MDSNKFIIDDGLLRKYDGEPIVNLVIPEEAQRICMNAFSNWRELETVTFHNKLEKIDHYAFQTCIKLTEVKIPGSVEIIDTGAFQKCLGLKRVVLEDGVKEIGFECFRACTALESIIIPESVTAIRGGAFKECRLLEVLTVPGKAEFIGDGVECKLIAPKTSLKNIGTKTKLNALKGFLSFYPNIDFYEEEVRKEYFAYIKRNQKKLSSEIGESLIQQMIESGEISGPSSTAVSRKTEKVTEKVQNKKPITDLKKIWKLKKNLDGTALISKYCGEETELNYPLEVGGVQVVGVAGRALKTPEGFEKITSVTIPEGYTIIGQNAFAGCAKLEHISLPETLEILEGGAFDGCENLKEITVPKKVKMVCAQTFRNCKKLEKVTLSGAVNLLGKEAFLGCKSLKSFAIPPKVGEFSQRVGGAMLFKGCTKLQDVYVLNPDIMIAVDSIFSGCRNYTVHGPEDSSFFQYLGGKNYEILTEEEKEYLEKQFSE